MEIAEAILLGSVEEMRTSHDSWHKEDDLEHATEAVKDFTKSTYSR
jgi:hypothetical protein